MNDGVKANSRTSYLYDPNNGKTNNFVTSEIRFNKAKYVDPLTLCFKLMVDFTKPYGLLADKKNINSALAYLERIGEKDRYELLVKWIEIFKILIKDYDFLILDVEGIDEIVNKKAGDMFTGEDKITISIRETSDMLVQSLITMYKHIWYDEVRQVEVLPANLRRFDISILVYSAGYYNMMLYDTLGTMGLMSGDDKSETGYETKIYPTIKKLSDGFFLDFAPKYEFNHHLINLGDAQINNEESGKSFFENISNIASDDFIKNTLTLNYRFANYRGTFNNIFGEVDFVKVLAISAAQDSVSNRFSNSGNVYTSNQTQPYLETLNKIKSNLKNYFADTKKNLAIIGKETITKLKDTPNTFLNGVLSKNAILGNALLELTDPKTVSRMIENKINNSIDQFTFGAVSKVTNLILGSFSNRFLNVYGNHIGTPLKQDQRPNNISLDVSLKEYEKPTQHNISLENNKNVFNRGGF